MTPIDAVRAFADTPPRSTRWRGVLALSAAVVLMPAVSYAQAGGSPWENAVNVLMTSFTGPIARGLSLVSIVIGGVTFAFGEGGFSGSGAPLMRPRQAVYGSPSRASVPERVTNERRRAMAGDEIEREAPADVEVKEEAASALNATRVEANGSSFHRNELSRGVPRYNPLHDDLDAYAFPL